MFWNRWCGGLKGIPLGERAPLKRTKACKSGGGNRQFCGGNAHTF